MKITDVKTVLLTGPITNDPSLLVFRKLRSAAFIEIHTDTGHVGVGETYIGYFAPEIIPEVVNFFKPILTGITDRQLEPATLYKRMLHCARFWARTGVAVSIVAGIEAALWDLRGKLDNKPVHELLGGAKHDRLLSYATGAVSNHPWPELHAKIDRYRSVGFRCAKFGAGWYDTHTKKAFTENSAEAWATMEVEKLESIRKHIGSDFKICMDAHMDNMHVPDLKPWDVATAKAVLEAVEPYDLLFFEEPLDYDQPEGYAELCSSTRIKVAGGECLTTPKEFQRWADLKSLDIAQPDASYIGISAFIEVARMFDKIGSQVAPHAWSAGAGVMANLHAAFASPNVAIVELPPLGSPLHTEIWAPGMRFDDGYVLPPEAPGLGVQLTDEIKNRFPFIPGSGEFNPVPGKLEMM